jgi:hypothetical protein
MSERVIDKLTERLDAAENRAADAEAVGASLIRQLNAKADENDVHAVMRDDAKNAFRSAWSRAADAERLLRRWLDYYPGCPKNRAWEGSCCPCPRCETRQLDAGKESTE